MLKREDLDNDFTISLPPRKNSEGGSFPQDPHSQKFSPEMIDIKSPQSRGKEIISIGHYVGPKVRDLSKSPR